MSSTIEEIQSEISMNIIRLRREKAWTQEFLANETQYSQAFINQLETGSKTCNVEQLYKLASVLDCSIHQILPDYKLNME